MPIYEYECPNGHITERLEIPSRNEDVIQCPQCRGNTARKIPSRSNWGFKKEDNGIRTKTKGSL